MPELPVKEVRFPELQLPEFDRAEIIRALSEIRRPTIDRSDLDRPTAQIRDSLAKIDWSRLDPTVIDIGRLAAGVATLGRAGRPLLRSRWTLAAGAVVAIGLAGAALLSNATIRERAGRAAGRVRTRIDARSGAGAALEVEDDLAPHLDQEDPALLVDADDVTVDVFEQAQSSSVD